MIPSATDILIVGSGISGFAAAIAAARENKKVVILEKSSSIGGDSTLTNVGTICGSFLRSFSGKPQAVGYRFCMDFLNALQAKYPESKSTLYHEGLYIIPYEWSILQQLMNEMLTRYNVTVLTNTELIQVNRNKNNIEGVTIQTSSQTANINLESIIDCSGNGIVSMLAKASLIQESTYQAASQVFRVTNIPIDNEFTLNMSIKRMMMQKIKENNWPDCYLSLSAVPGSLRDHTVDLKLTLPEEISDSSEVIKTIQEKAHRRIQEIFPVLQQHLNSFKSASLEYIFPSLGVRVQQRSKGQYVLTEEDVMSCKKSKEGIAIGTWPIEEWTTDGKLHLDYFTTDDGYDIPAGCLLSDEILNLYFAGKNISASSRAIASARVMGTGLQTGYAAGKLACSKNETQRSECITKLHRELHSI